MAQMKMSGQTKPENLANAENKDKKIPVEQTENEEFEPDILMARHCAIELLESVLINKKTLDLSLDGSEMFHKLTPRDRAFVRMLVATTLRRLGQIDDLIERAQDRPNSLKSLHLKNILRLGVCQLFYMEVPDHAAVDTSVQLADHAGMDKAKGFVNAILRTLIKTGGEYIKKQDPARLNTPEWLLKMWIDDYGLRGAAKIATANLSEAPLDITVKAKEDKSYWGNALKASELSTGTLRRMAGGNVRELEGFDHGKWWVQDASAALPAQLFGPIEGEEIIDLCAAPGGKTLQMAAMGANVIAIDRSAKRIKLLEENTERMGLKDKVKVVISDAAVWKPADEAPQRILLDAPCSATGTIRRHPDMPYLKSPKDIEGLTSIQSRLLQHAGNLLGIGGILIYCTCSLQKAEGENQIETFLRKNPKFSRVPITSEEVGDYEELISPDGDLRILPVHLAAQGGMDGFYVARLTKT